MNLIKKLWRKFLGIFKKRKRVFKPKKIKIERPRGLITTSKGQVNRRWVKRDGVICQRVINQKGAFGNAK